MRYAIVDNSTRKVINIIEWEGAEWMPPRNTIVIPTTAANIGDLYNDGLKQFYPAPPADPQPAPEGS